MSDQPLTPPDYDEDEIVKSLVINSSFNDVTISRNVSQDVYFTNTDKTELYLRDFEKAVAAKYQWGFPAGVFLTALTTLVTSSFHSAFGLKAEHWEIVFYLIAALSFAWAFVMVIRSRVQHEKTKISYVVNRLKRGDSAVESKSKSGIIGALIGLVAVFLK